MFITQKHIVHEFSNFKMSYNKEKKQKYKYY